MQQDYILSLSFDRGLTYAILWTLKKKLLKHATINKKTVQGLILKLALLTHNNISGTSIL